MKFYCHIENGGHTISTLDPGDNPFGEYPGLVYVTNHFSNPCPAVVVPVLTAEQCDAMIACLEHIKTVHLDRDNPLKYTYEFDKPEQE